MPSFTSHLLLNQLPIQLFLELLGCSTVAPELDEQLVVDGQCPVNKLPPALWGVLDSSRNWTRRMRVLFEMLLAMGLLERQATPGEEGRTVYKLSPTGSLVDKFHPERSVEYPLSTCARPLPLLPS